MSGQCEHIIGLIPAYLDGELSNDQKGLFESHIQQCDACALELEDYKQLFIAFKAEKEETPSPDLSSGFLKMLDEEKKNQVKVVALPSDHGSHSKNWFSRFLRFAASIALLVSVFLLGKYAENNTLTKELAEVEAQNLEIKQTAMISLLENQSASRRIQGVSYIQDFQNPDGSIIEALVDRMLNDENINVRLTALDALSNFTSSENVKTAFIEALKSERNPSIQIAIIQVLLEIQEKRAVGPMKKLLEQQETQPFIKDEINTVIPKII